MPYFPIKPAITIAIALSLIVVVPSHAESTMQHAGETDEHAAHQHGGHQTADLQLNHGQRWQTDAPLREGMVLTLEPGAVIAPGRMLVHEENIVLRANGPELLSPRAPAKLPVIAI